MSQPTPTPRPILQGPATLAPFQRLPCLTRCHYGTKVGLSVSCPLGEVREGAGQRCLDAPPLTLRWRCGWQLHALGFEAPLDEQPYGAVERYALALGVLGQGCVALNRESDVKRHPRDGPGWHEVVALWDHERAVGPLLRCSGKMRTIR